MVDGGPEVVPPVKRKRGRPRKADVLAAQAAAAAAAGDGGNGVISAMTSPGVPSAGKPDAKPRKPRRKKTEIPIGTPGVDANLVGKPVTGVLDGSFDAGYLLTVRVGDSDTYLRGVVFGPGLTVPVTKENDIAPHVKHIKREDIPFPATPTSVLTAAPVPIAVQAPAVAIRAPVATVAAPATAPATAPVTSTIPVPAVTNAVPQPTAAPPTPADVKPVIVAQVTPLPNASSQAHPPAVASSSPAAPSPTPVTTGRTSFRQGLIPPSQCDTRVPPLLEVPYECYQKVDAW
ncbi:hypothetical protein R1sor_001634 [Riccia sorocarpa]|uniref:Uncharacterized protein n=1 Tax=Riccia sorocarpa TaxID=122646 RepID=A0ABD3GWH8_9MARC